MWEVGILLIGIGVLILCIFLAVTVRDLGVTLKNFNQILTENEKYISEIAENTAGITGSVDNVMSASEKIVKALATFGAIKSAAGGRKKKQ